MNFALTILHTSLFREQSSSYLNTVLANFAKPSEDQESDIPAQIKPGKLIFGLEIIVSITAFITEYSRIFLKYL